MSKGIVSEEDDEIEEECNNGSDFSEAREIEIQLTNDAVESYAEEEGADRDSDNFTNRVAFDQGSSRENVEMSSWEDMPKGYEPVDDEEAEKYQDYLESKELFEGLDDDEDD